MSARESARKLAAILNADVQGYSRLMAADEAATVRTITAYRGAMTALVGEHRGRVVDFTGDNLLAEFAKGLLYKDQAEADRVIEALRRAGLK